MLSSQNRLNKCTYICLLGIYLFLIQLQHTKHFNFAGVECTTFMWSPELSGRTSTFSPQPLSALWSSSTILNREKGLEQQQQALIGKLMYPDSSPHAESKFEKMNMGKVIGEISSYSILRPTLTTGEQKRSLTLPWELPTIFLPASPPLQTRLWKEKHNMITITRTIKACWCKLTVCWKCFSALICNKISTVWKSGVVWE